MLCVPVAMVQCLILKYKQPQGRPMEPLRDVSTFVCTKCLLQPVIGSVGCKHDRQPGNFDGVISYIDDPQNFSRVA